MLSRASLSLGGLIADGQLRQHPPAPISTRYGEGCSSSNKKPDCHDRAGLLSAKGG